MSPPKTRSKEAVRTSPRKAQRGKKTAAKAASRPAKTSSLPRLAKVPSPKRSATKTSRAPQSQRSSAAVSAVSEGIAYIDGEVVPLSQARISLQDRGYLLGDGVFETMRTSNGRVFCLEEHAARMVKGLAAINLDAALLEDFHSAVHNLVKAGTTAFGGELYVRVMMTTGPMEDVLGTGRGVTVTGLCKKFKPYPMQYYSKGIHLVVSRQRKDSRSPLSGIKTLSFLPYIAARRDAHAVAAHDALLLNEADRVAEASTSNVFALADGVVHAPGENEGAIPGVTRAVVLALVKEAGLKVTESLDLGALKRAQEVWLTNTTGGIVPVTRFQDRLVGDGKKGELTAQLSHALEASMRGKRHA